MINIWYYISGYLLIEVQGKALEKFINIAIEQGVYLWDIHKIGDKVYLKTHIKNFLSLRTLARRTQCHIHIVQKYGLPFFYLRIKNRKMLLMGAILFSAVIYIFSSYIWFIEIEGLKNVKPEMILKIAQSQGLEPGVLKWKIDDEKIEREMLKQINEISWLAININGSKASICVVEKIIVKEDMPCDLVAAKAGVIDRLIVLDGEPMVVEGDVVEKGQVLVKGIRKYRVKDQTGNDEEEWKESIRLTHAKAIIEGRIEYTAIETVPLKSVSEKMTGNFIREIGIALPNKEIIFNPLKQNYYSYYRKGEKRQKIFPWRNIEIPVEGIIITYREIERHEKKYTYEQAKAKAAQLAWEKIVSIMPLDARIVKRDVMVISKKDKDEVKVKLAIETIENIAEHQNIKEDTISSE